MCNKLQTEASAGGKQEMRRNSAYRGQHVIHDPPAAVVEAITPHTAALCCSLPI